MDSQGKGRKGYLTAEQLVRLHELTSASSGFGFRARYPSNADVAETIQREFGVKYNVRYMTHLRKRMATEVARRNLALSGTTVGKAELYLGDSQTVLRSFPTKFVDCVVTSPPYYGQRDYGVVGQLGLEPDPHDYVEALVGVFREVGRVLKDTGSVWINLGDTYWSGKGKSGGVDKKQKYRRFLRPQDRTGKRPLCVPKQLLLVPHRFAIAMQNDGWILRNDNVWLKENPTPDPVADRCASSHEYMFHFVKKRRYYFDMANVSNATSNGSGQKPPSSVWKIRGAPTFKKHMAVFPEELVRIPIRATLPSGGVLLDPFCGSGTSLVFALSKASPSRVIGVDIGKSSIDEAIELLASCV